MAVSRLLATAEQAIAADSLCAAFQITAAAHAERPALRRFGGGPVVSWGEYAQRVRAVAGGLATLGTGPGVTVALMLSHRPEANIVDVAALHLGAVPFSLDPTAAPEQTAYLLGNADAALLVTERELLPVVRAALDAGAEVEQLLLVDGEDAVPEGSGLTLAELERRPPPDGFDFEAAWRAVGGEDLATIVYTSGTTGVPKGVQLAHHVMLNGLRGVQALAPPRPARRVLAFLPMAHIAERFWSHYMALGFGFEIVGVSPAALLDAALAAERPEQFFAVPRTYEKLAASVRRMLDEGVPADAVPARLGLDRAEWLGVATAPSSPAVLELFAEIGLPVGDMWGMTEAVMTTITPPAARRPGTVGRPLPGVEVRTAADNELLIRGPNVFSGYRKDPERTRETLDDDGWVHSGDIGSVDPEGYVHVVSRKKEIMITSGGKNLAPAAIEHALKAHSPLIAYVATIADGRRYVTALIALEPDELTRYAAAHGLSGGYAELVAAPAVGAEVERAVQAANATLSKVEQVKRHRLVDAPWLPGGDEVTSTLKLRRGRIDEKHAGLIAELYA
jgi:long-subunit acyl-CoA synthetase (AMP-forming)